MKQIQKTITFSVLMLYALLWVGCYKDDSSDGVTPVNELAVSDTNTLKRIFVFPGDTLKLNPVLTQSMASNPERLSYIWKIYYDNPSVSLVMPYDTIARTRNLNIVIKDPTFTLGNAYKVIFTARDTITGIAASVLYNMTVSNKYVEGWMTLEEAAGVGDISFIFPNNTKEHKVYSSRNTTQLVNPKKLELTPFELADDISEAGKRLYILADNGSQEYNYLTLIKKFDYGFLFFSAPSVQKPERMTWVSASTNPASLSATLGIAINNGKVHSNLVGGFPGIKKWGAAYLTPGGTLNYSLAPYVAGGTTYTAVVYDNVGKRFYSAGATALAAFPASASTVFDMNNVGMDMVFMDSSNVFRQYNAVMKGVDNLPYLLRFTTTTTTASPAATLSQTAMDAPGILQMKAAASSTLTPHIYYSSNNVVRKYETTSNTTIDVYAFPVSEVVTTMKYQKQIPGQTGARLVVATWNGTEGKLYYFPVDASGAVAAYTHVFAGFSKIVDLAYKVP